MIPCHSKIELRPYQNDLIELLRKSIINGHKRLVLCAPTGSGKTIMFTYLISEHLKRGGRALVFTHRKELLKQAGSSFEKFGLTPEFINAGSTPDLTGPLHVAMIETFDRRKDDLTLFLQQKTLIIIDECHINNFTKIFEHINHNTVVIGATATPYRKGADVPALSEFYTDIIQKVDTQDLVDLGYLSFPESFGVKIRMDKMIQQGDDYDTTKYYSEHKMYEGVVSNWLRLTPNQKTILFASNVSSSKRVCEEFIMNGIECKHIEAKTPKNERESILEWFENTDDAVLCNVGILTAGYDCPDIKTIILYRATTSLPLFLQMVGRGSRTTDTKGKFTILDFGNNIHRLGFWQDRRVWSLKKVESRKNEKEDAGFIKMCKKCGAILPPSTTICPFCNSVIKKEEREIVAELSLLTKREKWNQDLQTKAIMCQNKLMNGFAVLHSLTDINEARYFCELMHYSNGFEHINKHRFKVFQR
jgi:superfamily II DNA or RNA helicase